MNPGKRRSRIPRGETRTPPTAPSPPRGVPPWLPLALLVAAVTVIVLWPVCSGEFLDWDDVKTIARNPALDPPTIGKIAELWNPGRPYMDLYVPVTYSVWGLVAAVSGRTAAPDGTSGLDPHVFHAANLILHAGAAAGVVWLFAELLAAAGLNARRARWLAAAAGALFALHPVQVESVAWASGLKDVLSGGLAIAALALFVRSGEVSKGGLARVNPRTDPARTTAATVTEAASSRAGRVASAEGRIRIVPYALATIAFLLAVLSKPSAIVLPLLAVILDGAMLGRPWTSVARRAAPWAALAAPLAIVIRRAQPASEGFVSVVWARPLVALDALAFYIGKLICPMSLALDYGRSPDWLLTSRQAWLTWLVPVAAAAAIWALRRGRPWLVWGAALFPAALLPVLGFLRFDFQRHSTVADHYLYLAMLGPCVLFAFFLASLRAREAAIVAAVVLLPLAALARLQTYAWHDTAALFEHTLRVNPASVPAHTNLGHTLYVHRRYEEAIGHYEAALRVRPDNAVAHNDEGNALRKLARPAEALEHFDRAVSLNGENAAYRFNRGLALEDLGRTAEAETAFKEAVRIDPGSAEAHANLGSTALRAGRIDDAIASYRRALEINPNLGPARRGLSDALAAKGSSAPSPR